MEVATWTEGLKFPEGPVLMPDGSVMLSELLGNHVVRIWPDGKKVTVAEPEGMPTVWPSDRMVTCIARTWVAC